LDPVKPVSPSASPQSAALAPRERRRRRREWGIAAALALLVAAGIALDRKLLLLSRALPIGTDAVFVGLIYLNLIGIGVLVLLVARNVGKLVLERRRGILGSRLNTKFVAAFVGLAAISTTALFGLSALAVNRAIGTWFRIEVAENLKDALDVSEAYYQSRREHALASARRIARQVGERRLLREDALEQLREFVEGKQLEHGLGVVEVFSARREQLASASNPEVPVVRFEPADSELVRAGLAGREETLIEEAGPGELVRCVVPIQSTFHAGDVVGAVSVNAFVPGRIATKVAAIRSGLASYRSLEPQRGAFGTTIVLVLALLAVSVVLFSVWIGFRLAKQITVPIQQLAGAAAEIAGGNLGVRVEHAAHDEIGLLVTAFNRMAGDVAQSREDLERRRAQMEIVLGAVAAGVLSLDRDGIVTTINPSALRLLGVEGARRVGVKVSDLLSGRALEAVTDLLRQLAGGPQEMLRRQLPLPVGDQVRTLNWTASRLRDPDGAHAGCVIVLDDVTQILQVQRMAAWREVARRIAHEIKNPLTPIQLSAQRLRRKLSDRLPDPEARDVLAQCTDAITGQVEALKLLVSEFSNFARLPPTQLARADLNSIVAETLAPYQEKRTIRCVLDLERELPLLELDREQIKRVILNLVENAIAALDAAPGEPRELRVVTRHDRAMQSVHLEVADTGIGVDPRARRRLFEPYFSSKRGGSGLGLAIVSRIVSDHSGYVRVRENVPRGTRFIVELPLRT
jgi:two-component system nitrogen regulation sensor histidine kinase NtrY